MEVHKTISLVGMLGSGKSTIGRNLAKILRLDFYDSDKIIEERIGKKVAQIIQENGAPYMRTRERETIAEILRCGKPIILATGGNAFIDETIRNDLLAHSIVVWIKADYEVLHQRVMRRDTRPEFINTDAGLLLQQMIQERHPIYAKSHITINNADQSVITLVKELKKMVLHYLSLLDHD